MASASSEYEVLELIGRGSFGQIRKVRRKSDGLILVRKEISYHRMTQKEREQLTAEFNILAQLKHPNIVEYFHRDHIKSDSTIHLYMEYCGNGDLSNVIRKCRSEGTQVPENLVWSIFTQIALALYRCHNGVNPPDVGDGYLSQSMEPKPVGHKAPVRVLHRDLKPENIFLGQDNDVKLGDFGLSKMLAPEQHLTNTYVGTPYYMSPEIVSDMSYTHKSDIWSLGCIIYELCQLTPPFNAKTQWALIDKIKAGQYPSISSHYSPLLKRAIDMCLQVDHRKRPDTAALLQMEPFMLARKQLSVVHLSRTLKLREEAIKSREQQLLALEEDMKAKWEERNILLYNQIDADLRQKWEVKAELEIRKRVEMEFQNRLLSEVAALLDVEVRKRIHQMGLVPEMRDSASSGSTDSSGILNDILVEEPLTQIAPDSPADVTMRSPSIIGTPARRRLSSAAAEEPPRICLDQDSVDLLDESPCRFSTAADNPFAITAPITTTTASATEAPRRIGFASGLPARAGLRARSGPQRFETAGTILFPNSSGNKAGLRGENMDDSATVNRAAAKSVPARGAAGGFGVPKSAGTTQAVSLAEIARQKQDRTARLKAEQPPPLWDRTSPDAPSPFMKRVLR